MLLENLIIEEKKNNKQLYSSGPYWDYKNSKAILEIKKKGLKGFRGLDSGVGTGYASNLVLDARNELGWKGRLISKIFKLPLINKIFKEQLFHTKIHIKEYLDALSIIYKTNSNVQELVKKYKFENTTEFGCIKKINYQNQDISTLYLDMADRVEKLSSSFDFSKIKSYFEIGGGFGANVHFLITNFPNIKKIIYLDAVPNIYVGTEYLRHFYKNSVKDFLITKKLSKIRFNNNNDLEIICIPPWEIEKLDVAIDHFHNAASFVEMPKLVIDNYCKFIKKSKPKEISLISYDKFDEETTFQPEELNSFFDNKLRIIWHDWLIKEYEKKLVYLFSKRI